MESSTINSKLDLTHHPQPYAARRQKILEEWGTRGKPDMVATLREHPDLLQQQSLLLELAIDEYEAHSSNDELDIDNHCARFDEFGSTVRRSIQCQLEVHRYALREGFDITWPRAGDKFAEFKILEQLGAGASSRVYLALEPAAGNRRVVLKVSPSTRFEASILGRLVHCSITPLYSNGFVAESNLHYLCMPFLARSTLVDVIEIAFRRGWPRDDHAIHRAATRWQIERPTVENPAGWRSRIRFGTYVDTVIKIAEQISEGMTAAHDNGILHCDLKPSNVLLTAELRPLIVDFNLSQDLSSAKVSWGGTIPYMPPEHLELMATGRHEPGPNTFTAASDIYSFGALVYELLTGTTPIGPEAVSASPQVAAREILARLRSGIQDPRDLNPLVGKRLSRTLLKCLEFDPIDRFTTMREVRHALKRDRSSLPSLARKARVRPALFAALYGAPAALLISSTIYAVTRPPSFEKDYIAGLNLLASNNTTAAIDKLKAAITANPSYSAARFELARARLSAGETQLAMSDFAHLANSENHLPSLAYLAYCFNLEEGNTEAIPLWEKVKASGLTTLAVRNNLAASYLAGSSVHSLNDRLKLAESELAAAHAIDPSSLSVNLNLVRLAVKKSKSDPRFDPSTAWKAAQSALNAPVANPFIKLHVALWRSQVRQFRRGQNIQAPDAAKSDFRSVSANDAEAAFQKFFASLDPEFDDKDQLSTIFEQQLRGNHLFLEPR